MKITNSAAALLLSTALVAAGAPGMSAEAAPAAAESVTAAATIQVESYGPDARNTLNIRPAPAGATTPAPIVITVPGGGWVREDNRSKRITEVSDRLNELGYAVFSPNYRVATAQRDGVPIMHQDIIRATRWVAANGARYGGDVSDINLLGGSSGAQLTTLAAELANVSTPGLVAGVIEMSGVMNWFDFRDLGLASTHEGAEAYLGCTLNNGGCTDAELTVPSPELRINPASPKHLLINGANEMLPPSQAEGMHESLRAAGIPSQLVLVTEGGGTQHGLALFRYTEDDIVAFIDAD